MVPEEIRAKDLKKIFEKDLGFTDIHNEYSLNYEESNNIFFYGK